MNTPLAKTLIVAAGVLAAATALEAQVLSFNFNQPGGPTNAGSAGASANLTYNSPATASANGSGVSGQSGDYAYTGQATYTSNAVSGSPFSALNGASQITVTGWMKLNSFGDDQDIIAMQSSYQNGFKISLASNGEIQFFDPEYYHLTSSTSGLYGNATSEWVFFAVSWDANAPQLSAVNYYYGTTSTTVSLVNTGTRSANVTNIGTNVDPFTVGNTPNLPSYQFWDAINGSLDNIAVYNSILNLNQIQAIQASAFVPEPGTAALLGLGLTGTLWMTRRRKAA